MSRYYENNGESHENASYNSFDHIAFWVGNAKQTASYYCTLFGFKPFAYKGLETGERDVASHAVIQNKIIFVFKTALNPGNKKIGSYLEKHGDSVKDIAFTVNNCDGIVQKARERGAIVVREPWNESDNHGSVRMAIVKTYGDITHTLVQRNDYSGLFLPGYREPSFVSPCYDKLPDPGLQILDHVVGNQPADHMLKVADWYAKTLLFHRFWSIDESITHTEYSAFRSMVITNKEETIKLSLNEPAPAKMKSHIQEFCDYNDGPGVQHIAMTTCDMISTVKSLRNRGVQFLGVPDTYYDDLRKRLADSPVKVIEDLDMLQKLNILVDFDDNGYLLQLFTKPLQDRPTLFLECIQRCNHQGFGAGNFKSLFGAIELDQKMRGNLV